jgi:hypothetical protein
MSPEASGVVEQLDVGLGGWDGTVPRLGRAMDAPERVSYRGSGCAVVILGGAAGIAGLIALMTAGSSGGSGLGAWAAGVVLMGATVPLAVAAGLSRAPSRVARGVAAILSAPFGLLPLYLAIGSLTVSPGLSIFEVALATPLLLVTALLLLSLRPEEREGVSRRRQWGWVVIALALGLVAAGALGYMALRLP